MQRLDTAVLRRAAIPTLLVGVVAAVVAALVVGRPGLVGAIVATVLVVVFFAVGHVVLDRVLASNPMMGQTVALTIYLVNIAVLFVLLLVLKDSTLFDTKVFALTVLACTLTWTTGLVWAFSRSKVLYVEPGSGPTVVPPDTPRRGSWS